MSGPGFDLNKEFLIYRTEKRAPYHCANWSRHSVSCKNWLAMHTRFSGTHCGQLESTQSRFCSECFVFFAWLKFFLASIHCKRSCFSGQKRYYNLNPGFGVCKTRNLCKRSYKEILWSWFTLWKDLFIKIVYLSQLNRWFPKKKL